LPYPEELPRYDFLGIVGTLKCNFVSMKKLRVDYVPSYLRENIATTYCRLIVVGEFLEVNHKCLMAVMNIYLCFAP
jgi:hypothetical protein